MATLGADYNEIQQEIGFFMGWGRVTSAYAAEQTQSIFQWIKSGLNRFMFGAMAPGMRNVYEWSFLGGTYRFGTQKGQTEYDLPSDFGSPSGPILWDSPTVCYGPVHIVNEAMVREKLSLTPSLTGIPQLAAVAFQGNGGAREQGSSLVIFPAPDGTYPLRLSYDRLAGMLTDGFPWPPGGAPHAETVKWACLAAACKKGVDSDAYEQSYQQSLAASVNYDARRKGDNLGQNNDRSDFMERRRDLDSLCDFRVKVGGVQY